MGYEIYLTKLLKFDCIPHLPKNCYSANQVSSLQAQAMANDQLPITDYQLPITGHTSPPLRKAIYKPPFQDFMESFERCLHI